jgi:uncharacterized protein (DUF433 family)
MNAIKDSALDEVVWVDAERMGGVPCFKETRVPIESLFVHLKHNVSLDDFLDDFPSVPREQAQALLDWAMHYTCSEAGALESLVR